MVQNVMLGIAPEPFDGLVWVYLTFTDSAYPGRDFSTPVAPQWAVVHPNNLGFFPYNTGLPAGFIDLLPLLFMAGVKHLAAVAAENAVRFGFLPLPDVPADLAADGYRRLLKQILLSTGDFHVLP